MTFRLALFALPLITLVSACATAPAEGPQRTSQYERPSDCPTGTRLCRRGDNPAHSGTTTMSVEDLRSATQGGAPVSR